MTTFFPSLQYGESVDYSLEEERKPRGVQENVYYKDDPLGTDDYRSAVASAAMGIGDAAKKGVGWINSIFQDPSDLPGAGRGFDQQQIPRQPPPRPSQPPRPVSYRAQSYSAPDSTQFSFLQDPVSSSIRKDIAASGSRSWPRPVPDPLQERKSVDQAIPGTGPLLCFNFKIFGMIEQRSFGAAIAYKVCSLSSSCSFVVKRVCRQAS